MNNDESTAKFAEKAVLKFQDKITDAVFVFIQSDRELMSDYIQLVEKVKHDSVNRWIGRKVKTTFHLKNDEIRNNEPNSTLIKSTQLFL